MTNLNVGDKVSFRSAVLDNGKEVWENGEIFEITSGGAILINPDNYPVGFFSVNPKFVKPQ
jgi:hypothetical protein